MPSWTGKWLIPCFSLFVCTVVTDTFVSCYRVAHALSDGEIPQETIKYDLTDLVIRSLRSIPEHKPLVCNWAAMLRVLQRDDKKRSKRKSIKKGDQRTDTVKQRVLLQMLTASAKMEVVDATSDGALGAIIDPDVKAGRAAEHTSLQTSKKQKKNVSTHEELTLALLHALPDLLTSFKSETFVLQHLTSLPQYFCTYKCASCLCSVHLCSYTH